MCVQERDSERGWLVGVVFALTTPTTAGRQAEAVLVNARAV